jgi:hypothetical protein
MLEEMLARIGVAAALSTGIAIGFDRERPRYLLGAIVGIPTAGLVGGIIPPLTAPIGAAYLTGTAGYLAAKAAGLNERGVAIATMTLGAIGGAGSVLTRYF